MSQQFQSWVYIQKKKQTWIWKDTCIPIFIAVLFAIAKICNQAKCPSTDEWIKKTWAVCVCVCVCVCVYMHNGILLSHIYIYYFIPNLLLNVFKPSSLLVLITQCDWSQKDTILPQTFSASLLVCSLSHFKLINWDPGLYLWLLWLPVTINLLTCAWDTGKKNLVFGSEKLRFR